MATIQPAFKFGSSMYSDQGTGADILAMGAPWMDTDGQLYRLASELPAALFTGTLKACKALRFDHGQTWQALKDAKAFYDQEQHRCDCCHNWLKRGRKPLGLVLIGDDGVYFAVACRQCQERFDRGEMTQAMERKLAALVSKRTPTKAVM